MTIYNLIDYKDNYSKTSRNLWQYYKDITAVDNKEIGINEIIKRNEIINNSLKP